MAQHIDPDFARRVAEYQSKAKKGVAFQAEGTVGGRRARPQRAAWRARPIRSLIRLAILLLIVKVTVFHTAKTFDLVPESQVITPQTPLLEQVEILALYPDQFSVNFSWFVTLLQTQVADSFRGFLSVDLGKVIKKE
jgi:hypothetical protein